MGRPLWRKKLIFSYVNIKKVFLFILDDASILKLSNKKYPYFYISGFYPEVKFHYVTINLLL